MKVTFSCEKCGCELGSYPSLDKFMADALTVSDPTSGYDITKTTPCPVCSQPTYGPLTVGMVAEALRESGKSQSDHRLHFDEQARFVIRLYEWLNVNPLGVPNERDDVRERVMEIARWR